MIKKEEVKKTAFLGRINLTDDEIVRFQKELNEVLDYVDGIKKATFNKKSKPNPRIKNIFRQDEHNFAPHEYEKREEEAKAGLLIQKNTDKAQFKVLNVFKK